MSLSADSPLTVEYNTASYLHHFTTVAGDALDYDALVPDAGGIYEAEGFLTFTAQGAGTDPGSGSAILQVVRGVTVFTIAASEGMHPGWPVGTDNSPALVLPFNSGGPFEMLAGDHLRVLILSSVASAYGAASIAASLGARWVAPS